GAGRLVGFRMVVEPAECARGGEVRRRLSRGHQQDALCARLVWLCLRAFGAACRGESQVARRSQNGGGPRGYGTAAGGGVATRSDSFPRRRSRTDAEYLRRQC